MSSISEKLFINAQPERVFDLICRVEDFVGYSSHIKEITEVSPGIYRWRVEFLGFTLKWEAIVIESRRPERFAWRSSKGVFNTGCYELKESAGGTEVAFEMEFSLTGSPLEAVIAPLLNRIIAHVAEDLLIKIKHELEA
jgi:uncharacterized membrane protein